MGWTEAVRFPAPDLTVLVAARDATKPAVSDKGSINRRMALTRRSDGVVRLFAGGGIGPT